MKEQMIFDVAAKLDQLNVPYTKGQKTDLSISCEFLDAGWSTGKKKINYDAFVLFDPEKETVYMWECTTEKGSGLSFGSESESSFQSGTTLFRKVKSIQYGPEGQVYEYTLDLGAIPKAVKESAKTYGWKFKTVLKKEKALYPVGYAKNVDLEETMDRMTYESENPEIREPESNIPETESPTMYSNAGQVEQNTYQNNMEQFPSENKVKHKVAIGILFGLALLSVLVCFAGLQVSMIGWIFGIATLVLFLLLARKISTKGIIPIILVWILTMFIAFVILVFGASSEALEDEPVSLNKPVMAAEVDSVTMKPVKEVTTFTTDTSDIYATALVKNAPEETKISVKWIYVTGNVEAAASEVYTTAEEQYVAFQVTKPDSGFPTGEYKVELYLNDVLDETLEFVVQ